MLVAAGVTVREAETDRDIQAAELKSEAAVQLIDEAELTQIDHTWQLYYSLKYFKVPSGWMLVVANVILLKKICIQIIFALLRILAVCFCLIPSHCGCCCLYLYQMRTSVISSRFVFPHSYRLKKRSSLGTS